MTQLHPIQHDVTMFVTTNVQGREILFSNPTYAREAIENLYRVQEIHPYFLYGFVVMPDHFHALLKVLAPKNISTVMNRWKMGVSHSIGIGPIWQPRFFMRIPNDPCACLRYIHQNPVKAGLCETAEEYPWSSANGRWDVTPLDMQLSDGRKRGQVWPR